MTSPDESRIDGVVNGGPQESDVLRHTAKDLATTVLLLAGAALTEWAKAQFDLHGVVLVALNVSELSLILFLLGSLIGTLRRVVVNVRALIDTVGTLGPLRAARSFIRGFVPDTDQMTQGFKLGVSSGVFMALFIAIALATARGIVLVPLAALLVLFIGMAIFAAAAQGELAESGGGVVLVVLLFLGFGGIVFIVVSVALGAALALTGSTDPVSDFLDDLLHRQ